MIQQSTPMDQWLDVEYSLWTYRLDHIHWVSYSPVQPMRVVVCFEEASGTYVCWNRARPTLRRSSRALGRMVKQKGEH